VTFLYFIADVCHINLHVYSLRSGVGTIAAAVALAYEVGRWTIHAISESQGC